MSKSHLTTARLHLEMAQDQDLPFAINLLSNPQVRQYLGGPTPKASAQPAAKALLTPAKGEIIWTARLKTDPSLPIGLLSLTHHKGGQDIEMSYQFSPKYWRQGFASEACCAALNHGFTDLALPRIIAETQTANTASVRLLTHLGFTETHRLTRFGAAQILFEIRAQTAP